MAKGLKTGGRTKGTPNKITSAFKDAVRTVYDDIGGHKAFAAWAKDNPGDFYRIAARLIPTEVHQTGATGLTIIVDRSCGDSMPQSGVALIEGSAGFASLPN